MIHYVVCPYNSGIANSCWAVVLAPFSQTVTLRLTAQGSQHECVLTCTYIHTYLGCCWQPRARPCPAKCRPGLPAVCLNCLASFLCLPHLRHLSCWVSPALPLRKTILHAVIVHWCIIIYMYTHTHARARTHAHARTHTRTHTHSLPNAHTRCMQIHTVHMKHVHKKYSHTNMCTLRKTTNGVNSFLDYFEHVTEHVDVVHF